MRNQRLRLIKKIKNESRLLKNGKSEYTLLKNLL